MNTWRGGGGFLQPFKNKIHGFLHYLLSMLISYYISITGCHFYEDNKEQGQGPETAGR